MNINRNNYEEFFINYLDGNLSEKEVVELENFLLSNPELGEELEGLQKVVLDPGDITFSPKENLKQIDLSLPVTEKNIDFFCVADLEGDLSPKQKDALKKYLDENPTGKSRMADYRKIRLHPDPALQYMPKENLRRSIFTIYRREVYTAIAVAASIALLVTLYFGYFEHNLNQINDVAVFTPDATTSVDSTSAKQNNSGKKNIDKTPLNTSPTKNEKPETPVTPKPSSKGFSFKVEMPIASATSPDKGPAPVDVDQLLSSVRIDPGKVNENDAPVPETRPDRFNPIYTEIPVRRKKLSVPQAEYASTVEKFARDKLSNLVFGKDSHEEITVWNVVTAGIDKVNDLTGSNMKLERETDPKGQTKALKFKSKLLKIDTPVNKDED